MHHRLSVTGEYTCGDLSNFFALATNRQYVEDSFIQSNVCGPWCLENFWLPQEFNAIPLEHTGHIEHSEIRLSAYLKEYSCSSYFMSDYLLPLNDSQFEIITLFYDKPNSNYSFLY